MAFQVTEEQWQLCGVLRELFESKARPRASFDGGPALDAEVWAGLVELGLTTTVVPERFGGAGGQLFDQALLAEQAGVFDVAVPVVTPALAGLVVSRLARRSETDAALSALSELVDGRVVLAAVSASRGLDLGIAASASAGGWTLDGEVPDLLEAACATSLIVPASTAEGRAWFQVDVAGSGVELADQPSLDQTQRLAAVAFSGATTRLVGRDEDDVLPPAWTLLAAQALGAADRALRLTVAYSTERTAFGQPIGRFQAIKHRAAEMLLDVENARSATYNAAWAWDDEREDAVVAAHLAKAVATENAVSVVHAAIQSHGGIGYTWEHDLHLLLRRAKSCELVLGSPPDHFEAIAAALLDSDVALGGAVA